MTASIATYEAERLQLMQRRATEAALLAVVLVPLFGIVDFFMYPGQFGALMCGRLLSTLAAFLLWSHIRRGDAAQGPSLAFALTLQCSLSIAVLPIYLTGTNTPHYVSACILILATTALLPWKVREVAVLTLSVTAMIVAAGLLHGPLPDVVGFATQVSAIVATGVIGLVVSALSESVRRREFSARSDLLAASKEKTHLIQHLEEMAARLGTANEDMQERQRETEDFLYVLSHDLRAPLINIQGFGKRLHDDMLSLESRFIGNDEATKKLGRMKQSLDFVNAGTTKIDQLISRLLDVARLTTRPASHQWVDTTTLVLDVLKACRFQLDSAGVEVSVGDLPNVWADPVQLNQVFTNLIDNAVKYMGERSLKQIVISHALQGDRYRFAVRDSGPGIDAKDREKVFRLFARLAPNGKTGGDGVGLATVRAIVNRHGGRIWVDSVPGDGSTFFFTLPRQPPAPPPQLSQPSQPTASTTRLEEAAAHVH